MSQNRTPRGRPQGSGLDDRARLEAVAQLMAKDKGLKATTAIKATGISDPSAIRRLREKFKEMQASGAAVETLTIKTAAVPAPASKKAAARPRAAAAGVPKTPKKSAPARHQPDAASDAIVKCAAEASPPGAAIGTQSLAQHPELQSQPEVPRQQTGAAWIGLWYGLGLQSLSTVVGLQMALVESVLESPTVKAVLSHQAAVNSFTLALCVPRTEVRMTVH